MTKSQISWSVAMATLALAGCVDDPLPPKAEDPHAVQVGAPGHATCPATSPAQNAAGAAATNQPRARAGLSPVRPDPALARVAAAHACDMAKRGRMTHIGTATSGPGARVRAVGYAPSITAENIAAGPFSLPRVHHEWNTSQGHLANIMLPQVSDYGVGQAVSADGRTTYWAAVYAAPRQAPVRRSRAALLPASTTP